jgi:drug/metabolite transporter (DMT)-like permease
MGLLIVRSLFYYALGVVLYTQALLLTKISNVTFVDSVPMVALLGFLFLKEKFYFKKAIFILTSFLGVLIISAKTGIGIFSIGKGELFALASAFFISLAMISRKWHSNKLNDQEIATITLLFGSIFVFIISLFFGESLPVQSWTSTAVFFILLGGILNVGISYFVNFGLSRVDTALSSNLFSLTPVFALILGLVLFKEIPQIKELIGGAFILTSVISIHNLGNNY